MFRSFLIARRARARTCQVIYGVYSLVWRPTSCTELKGPRTATGQVNLRYRPAKQPFIPSQSTTPHRADQHLSPLTSPGADPIFPASTHCPRRFWQLRWGISANLSTSETPTQSPLCTTILPPCPCHCRRDEADDILLTLSIRHRR